MQIKTWNFIYKSYTNQSIEINYITKKVLFFSRMRSKIQRNQTLLTANRQTYNINLLRNSDKILLINGLRFASNLCQTKSWFIFVSKILFANFMTSSWNDNRKIINPILTNPIWTKCSFNLHIQPMIMKMWSLKCLFILPLNSSNKNIFLFEIFSNRIHKEFYYIKSLIY